MKYFAMLVLLITLSWCSLVFAGSGVDSEANLITFSLRTEPPNLDSSLTEDTTSGHMLRLMNEGLVRIGPRGEVIPGVANSWDLDVKGATFHLRKTARWADGVPVTADDFVYAWRRLVDPSTGAQGSTLFAYLLENAEDIMGGRLAPETLGVEAIDQQTLRVTMSRPAPYLLTVLAGTAYMPLRQDFVEKQAGRFAADAKNLLSNGPFKIESWIHGASLGFSKNTQYWDQANIHLDAVDVGYITSDVRSLFNVFKSKEIATLQLNEEILNDAIDSGIRVKKKPSNCLAWLTLNHRPEKLTANPLIRQAIRLAFDRDGYVNNIVGLPGVRKIDSLFTRRIKGVKANFQKKYPAPVIDLDLRRARQLVAQVRQEYGKPLPALVLLANETRQIEAEYIQAQLKTGLGLDIRVDKQTFKQAIAKMRKGDFDMTRVGFCGGAIRDPIVYASVFESSGPFNDGGFHNVRYDELLQVTHNTVDAQQRMAAFAEMQQLMFDHIPMIPTHEYSYVYLEDIQIKGLMRFPTVNFSRGFIE